MNNIIPNGSKVVFKGSNVEAMIIGVCVRGENNLSIEYEVACFMNGERKTWWIHNFEVEPKQDNKPIGFRSNNNKPLIGKY